MAVKNFYPSKPVIPFQSTPVGMDIIIASIKMLNYPAEIKRAAYILIRNESSNGRSVINGTNPGGVQSDSGLWPDKWNISIVATSTKMENRTGKIRGFVVFDSLASGIAFMCERIQARGIYVGGTTHKITEMSVSNKDTLAIAYYREWVTGIPAYNPTPAESRDFVSMYIQAEKMFL